MRALLTLDSEPIPYLGWHAPDPDWLRFTINNCLIGHNRHWWTSGSIWSLSWSLGTHGKRPEWSTYHWDNLSDSVKISSQTLKSMSGISHFPLYFAVKTEINLQNFGHFSFFLWTITFNGTKNIVKGGISPTAWNTTDLSDVLNSSWNYWLFKNFMIFNNLLNVQKCDFLKKPIFSCKI